MKPFLLLATRAEDAAADNEYESFLACTGLGERDLRWHWLEQRALGSLDLRDWSGIFLGGGPFSCSDREELKSPVQRRVEADLRALLDEVTGADFPFLGACYGIGTLGSHQGAAVGRQYAEPVGVVAVTLTREGRQDPLLGGLPPTFDAFTGHKEAISMLPGHAVLLARSPACPVQAFRVGSRCVRNPVPSRTGRGLARVPGSTSTGMLAISIPGKPTNSRRRPTAPMSPARPPSCISSSSATPRQARPGTHPTPQPRQSRSGTGNTLRTRTAHYASLSPIPRGTMACCRWLADAYRSSNSACRGYPQNASGGLAGRSGRMDHVKGRSARPSPSGVELEDAAGRSPAQSPEVNPGGNFCAPFKAARRAVRASGSGEPMAPGTGYGTRSLVPRWVVLVRPGRPGKAVEHDERDGADDRDEADEPPEPALAGVAVAAGPPG